jgi:hypothetical protein
MSENQSDKEMNLEELATVAGGSKNGDNEVVKTVISAFNNRVHDAQHEAIRANGPLGSTFPGHF